MTGFTVNDNESTDVVFFLKRGEDIKGYKNTLRDLQQRLSLTPTRSFVASHDFLAKDGAVTVYDAIIASGMLPKTGLKFGSSYCLLVDGHPRTGFPVTTLRLDNIDFIEVFGYKADIGNSLRVAMGNSACTFESNIGPTPPRYDLNRYIQYIAVWTKR